MKVKQGFTLVELLVVIGIIGLLVSILLPALAGAREQANTTVCMSNMHQFYTMWHLYVDDYRGYVLPCSTQLPTNASATTTTQYDWWSYYFLGHELNKGTANVATASLTAIQNVSLANGYLVHELLTCPSANHSQDPNYQDPGSPTQAMPYFGDYIYNMYMGYTKYSGTPPTGTQIIINPVAKFAQVPSNVMILTEMFKPNAELINGVWVNPYDSSSAKQYSLKFYFGGNGSNSTTWIDLIDNNSNSTPAMNRIGTPHGKGTKCTMLSADGHVSLLDPFMDGGVLFLDNVGTITPVKNSTFPNRSYVYAQAQITATHRSAGPLFRDYLIGPGINCFGQSSSSSTGLGAAAVPMWNAKQLGLP